MAARISTETSVEDIECVLASPCKNQETYQRLLRPAVQTGCIEMVEALMDRGADLNMSCDDYQSALVVALRYLEGPRLMKMVTFLVENGVYMKQCFGAFSAIAQAVFCETDVVLYLLQNGADVNEVADFHENTPLIYALFKHWRDLKLGKAEETDDLDVLREKMLYEGADVNVAKWIDDSPRLIETLLLAGADVNKANRRSETALHKAVQYCSYEIICNLIKAGAQLDAKNCAGNTALHLAVQNGKYEISWMPIEVGAQLETQDRDGNTSLHHATKKEYCEISCELIKAGAQLDVKNCDGNTALHLATKKGSVDISCELIKAGAQLDVQNCDGNTALHLATEKGNCKILCELIKAGAQLDVKNCDGNTAFHLATEKRNCEISFELIKAGAQLEMQDNHGCTVLHTAAGQRNNAIVRELIKAGAQLEARDSSGKTPIMYADWRENAHLLKNCGANIRAVDNDGKSALHHIIRCYHLKFSFRLIRFDHPQRETLRLLAIDNDQINRQSNDGMTPLMEAAGLEFEEAMRFLLELGADPNIVSYASGKPLTALSVLLESNYNSGLRFTCAEQLIKHGCLSTLPQRCWDSFFMLISFDDRKMVQLMIAHGMAPVLVKLKTLKQLVEFAYPYEIIGAVKNELSPLAAAILSNNTQIAQYLVENWFLTPADLVGSLELRELRSLLEKLSLSEGVKFMDENLSQPMSLMKLSFVAVSAQLGGVAGREERVSQTPLRNILKDKLLFRHENFPMDLSISDDENATYEYGDDE
ncbi:serine/threonine-protein phosphatase 6 regulatory ankyrin repeat subunit b [Plakobranchus ocellatus]|uniref:Serine/threonine-protein phosphatase 6 regulatory ankyrin repeat subunit b n=1 Tax=Plakobranchus ocellatus TaxID=259542 RepID=A0AAV4B6P3_9GAST|nr:serine/threonine-protein phosphatase 6 regulatory ankyrin repeat subunit b [Plakobranchus ocellatus]